jgi:hypothetical protein
MSFTKDFMGQPVKGLPLEWGGGLRFFASLPFCRPTALLSHDNPILQPDAIEERVITEWAISGRGIHAAIIRDMPLRIRGVSSKCTWLGINTYA